MAQQEMKWIASDATAWDTESAADLHDAGIAFSIGIASAVRMRGCALDQKTVDAIVTLLTDGTSPVQLSLNKSQV